MTILLARGELESQAEFAPTRARSGRSSKRCSTACAPGLKWMRDPTRGGVATALNELVARCDVTASRSPKKRVPMHDVVRGACELLGLDPLHIANEGQFLAVVARRNADAALAALRSIAGWRAARRASAKSRRAARRVRRRQRRTAARASIDMLVGDPLPRIC